MAKPQLCVTVTAPTTAELREKRDAGVDADLIELCLDDCVPLLALGAEASRHGDIVIVGMGDYGFSTRLLAGRFGSAWTYAGALHDIGQVTAPALLTDYRLRSITDSTAIYGVVGGS